MLDLGLWEIATIVIIAVLVLKPEDIPEVLRTGGKYLGKLKGLGRELTDALTEVKHDSGIEDVKYEMKKIIDLEGNEREAYDVSAIEELKEKD